MSVEENKDVIRRFFDEANKKNLDALPELITSDFVLHADGREIRGAESYRKGVSFLINAFPDWHFMIHDLVAEGDKVVCHFTTSGTHQGDLRGIAPTGKQIEIQGIAVYYLKDGKIAEIQEVNDRLNMYQQLGINPTN